MSYAETDPDINGDGKVNLIDKSLENLLKVWCQEIGEPFRVIKSLLDKSNKTVSAALSGFTEYAIAY